MKINFDIECTPEEARAFLGLPDVSQMQKELMEDIQKQMKESISSMDAESLMKTWLPLSMQGMNDFQKMFWDNMKTGMGPSSGPSSDKKDK